jgi:S1-C subfamily serine protease
MGWLLPLVLFTTVMVGVLYAAPVLLLRWGEAQAQVQAEAAYQKRRAELKAETEAALELLPILDKQTSLLSLGFQTVIPLMTPKVVHIAGLREVNAGEPKTPAKHGGVFHDPYANRYFVATGNGSGLIVKPGYVLTNYHVIKGMDRLRVTFASGQSVWVEMERVASDPVSDLAVVKLPDNPTGGLKEDYNQTATFANSATEVHIGNYVLAVGSPRGLKDTVTHGIISAKGRFGVDKFNTIELLQTDAPINPGNSGGPLFNLHGKVVGINVAILSDNGSSQGIGFAIPSNTASAIFEELVAKGTVTRGFIGVEMDELPPLLAKELKLENKGTVYVKRIIPGFPAAEAQLHNGDIIVALDGHTLPVTDPLSFFRQQIMETPVGTKIKLEVVRVRERTEPTKPSEPPTAGRAVQHLSLTVIVAAMPKGGVQ